jgi:hypothetical protein
MRTEYLHQIEHLPTKKQNLLYVSILITSSLINLLVASFIYQDAHHTKDAARAMFPLIHHALAISPFVLGSILVLMGISLVHSMLHHSRRIRKSLLILGILSGLYMAINILTISYGIYVFKIQSYLLLAISVCVYLSVNATFVFWYWYVDYPTQVRSLHHPDNMRQIVFPRQSQISATQSAPGFLDYLYLAVITSNTLGSPENHSPDGQKAKAVMMMHSLTMMILLVVFVSRAINTLS